MARNWSTTTTTTEHDAEQDDATTIAAAVLAPEHDAPEHEQDSAPEHDAPEHEQDSADAEHDSTAEHVATWRAVADAAVANADVATGTLTAVDADAVAVATRRLPRDMRADIPAAWQADASARAFAEQNIAALAAVNAVMAAVARGMAMSKLPAAPALTAAQVAANALAVLDSVRAAVLADLSDDDRAAVLAEQGATAPTLADDVVASAVARILPTVRRVAAGKRSGSGAGRPAGAPRGDASPLAPAVRDALLASNDDAMTIAAIVKVTGRSRGALDNLWTRTQGAPEHGVIATTVDGSKAFMLAEQDGAEQ